MQDQVAHDQAAQAKVVGVGGAARPIDDDELAKVCQMLCEAIAMRERYAPAESETLALDQALENVLGCNVGDCADQQLAQNFQAVLLAAGLRVAQYAVGLKNLFE